MKMKKNFDLYEELEKRGFEKYVDIFGRECLKKDYEKEVEVVWHGKVKTKYSVEVAFNSDKSIVNVEYFNDRTSVKTKTHLNEKRALNAISMTVKNAGFEL